MTGSGRDNRNEGLIDELRKLRESVDRLTGLLAAVFRAGAVPTPRKATRKPSGRKKSIVPPEPDASEPEPPTGPHF